MFMKRLLASGALGGCVLLATAAAPSIATAATTSHASAATFPLPTAASQGASWLAGQLNASGYVPSATTPGTADLSATANTVLALASANADPTGTTAAISYLESHVSAYIAQNGNDGPGQLALLILDAHALGINPHSFGGIDLVQHLLNTEQKTGADTGMFGTALQVQNYAAGDYQQGLALAALAGVGVTDQADVGAANTWLIDQQCSDGGWTAHEGVASDCVSNPANYAGPDTNSTAVAIEGLEAQGVLTPVAASSATTFLLSAQDADAGWSYYPNTPTTPGASDPNSTGLVIQAILALGQSPTASQYAKGVNTPVTALLSFRVTSGTGAGAFFFPGSSAPDLLATSQAVPAAAGVVFPFVANFGSTGYWLTASDGGIFAFGNAAFQGSHGGSPLNKPIVGMASTPDGGGYWLVASDGGIFSYGDATFHGSAGALTLNKPIVGMASTPDGGGYWLVASDGGIFSYGDATFHGSAGALTLNKPIVGIASTPDGGGYWLVASDGGIFSYGDATFHGSAGALTLNKPIVGIARTLDGNGYWLVATDGGIFAYGNATFAGSQGGAPLNAPIVGLAGAGIQGSA
jgi:hypothetical protein